MSSLRSHALLHHDAASVCEVLRDAGAVADWFPAMTTSTIEHHLGTVDVIELRPGRSLLLYSTEIEPPSLEPAGDGAVSEAVPSLGSFLSANRP